MIPLYFFDEDVEESILDVIFSCYTLTFIDRCVLRKSHGFVISTRLLCCITKIPLVRSVRKSGSCNLICINSK